MPKITFIVDHTPKGQAADRPTYKAGETYDLEQSYAEKYKRLGFAVDEAAAKAKAKAERAQASYVAKLEARGKVLIPADLTLLEPRALIDLASSLSDDAVRNKDDAVKAIDAELARRSPT